VTRIEVSAIHLGVLEIAELLPRRVHRRSHWHPSVDQLSGPHLEMKLELFVDFVANMAHRAPGQAE
jgi:hypothetical protein